MLSSYKLVTYPFAGTVLARELYYRHASFPDPGRKTSPLIVTHCHTSWSMFLGSLQKITCACAGKLSITNVTNQTCSQISGTCCRQDTLGLLLLELPTVAGLCIQVCAYRCMIHALNECCRTSPSNLPCIRTKSGQLSTFLQSEARTGLYAYDVFSLKFTRTFKISVSELPIYFPFPIFTFLKKKIHTAFLNDIFCQK